MNNVLIINLKRNGDILALGHLVNSLNASSNDRISLLVFEEFKNAAKLLKNVAKIYTIKRKQFLSLKKNNIFHDIYALEEIFQNLEEIRNQRWNNVINTSNDRLSGYVSSLISYSHPELISGIYFDKNNSVSFSGKWARVLNDILPCYKYTPVSQIDCLHYLQETLRENEGQKVLSSPQHNKTAFENINKIRENESKLGNKIKIVGIQLLSSDTSKDISFNSLVQLIDMIVNNPAYFPILMIAPQENEREYANKVNKYFNNSLVSVESDFTALPSVLLNIDLLVTPDTVVKHMADLLDTPVVEVSLGWAPFLKQGTINPNSVVLTQRLKDRCFSRKDRDSFEKDNEMVKGSDIYNAIRCAFEPRLDEVLKFSPGLSLFRPREDKLGNYYECTSGDRNKKFELPLLVSRYALFKMVIPGYKDEKLLKKISTNYKYMVKEWIHEEKNEILNYSKVLLSSIRYLTATTNIERAMEDFTYSLDELLSGCEKDHIIAMPLLIFRSYIENLSSSHLDNNRTKIETYLYDLKKNIQKVAEALRDLENNVEEIRKNDLVMGRDKNSNLEARL